MANGIATRKDCETELDALFLATASLGNCEANDGDDDDDGRITQSAWNFYSRSGGIHNKSALEVAAVAAVVARFPLGSRPTNGARTAVAAGQAEARTGADIEAIAGIQPGASAATGDTQWTHTMTTTTAAARTTPRAPCNILCGVTITKGGVALAVAVGQERVEDSLPSLHTLGKSRLKRG